MRSKGSIYFTSTANRIMKITEIPTAYAGCRSLSNTNGVKPNPKIPPYKIITWTI